MTDRELLCVADVGNTHTVVGVYDGEALIQTWRLRTDRERTTDEWGLNLGALFGMRGLDMAAVTGMAIASVVPPALHALRRASQRYFRTEALVVGPGIKTGLPIRYDNPREVGADRVVNAVAAFARVKRACIVVDFGTATTFDCISQKGEYLGGAICPGLQISLDALVSRAAKLPRVEIGTPAQAIGRNTEEAMTDGMVKRLAAEMGGEVAVIATGGFAGTVAAHAATLETVIPDLTLEGLRLIWLRNK